MDRVEEYREYIQKLIQQHSQPASIGNSGVETQVLVDREHDHYQIIRAGWRDEEYRVYGCLIHIDIKDGKIWIQWDGTEVGTANELVEMGVPKEDIVLAFYPPYKRPYTGFGVN